MAKSKRKIKKTKFNIFKIFAFLSLLFLLVSFIGVKLNNNTPSCANSISCIKNLSGAFEENEAAGEFEGKIALAPTQAKDLAFQTDVLGKTAEEKRIEIDLTNQRLYAYEGDKQIYNFLVSTGKWGRTPTGTFRIWIKLRYTRMTGGNKDWGTYYNLPNVPYTMYFYNNEIPKYRGYGVHGAYWHNNFGHPMSHGCINMREEDVAQLYNWADPPSTAHTTYADDVNLGTKIVIYGTAPIE